MSTLFSNDELGLDADGFDPTSGYNPITGLNRAGVDPEGYNEEGFSFDDEIDRLFDTIALEFVRTRIADMADFGLQDDIDAKDFLFRISRWIDECLAADNAFRDILAELEGSISARPSYGGDEGVEGALGFIRSLFAEIKRQHFAQGDEQ
jgi:hypothetical protein